MKPTQSILTLLSLFLISNCGDKVREEITDRYDDGKLKIVEYYKKVGNNQELVRKREYYENGQIEEEYNYKDGNKDGKWIWYYENGQIKFENNYKDGILNGKMIFYFENGQIESDINYKNGEKVGKLIQYDDNETNSFQIKLKYSNPNLLNI